MNGSSKSLGCSATGYARSREPADEVSGGTQAVWSGAARVSCDGSVSTDLPDRPQAEMSSDDDTGFANWTTRPTFADAQVLVLDEDPNIHHKVSDLLTPLGMIVTEFSSPEALLSYVPPVVSACLILNSHLTSMTGLDVQLQLRDANVVIPTVFMVRPNDIRTAVRAVQGGAVDVVTKPLVECALFDALTLAFAHGAERRRVDLASSNSMQRYRSLTPREKEVMVCVTEGMMNKNIACELGISEITVKMHRRQVMRKTGAATVCELVRLADMLGIAKSTGERALVSLDALASRRQREPRLLA